MSIKKISSSNKVRINTMYVNGHTEINQINSISPIKKINNIHNQSFQSSQNNFFGTSNFYDHLKKLKKEYFHFYKVQQELEDTLKEFKNTTNTTNTTNLISMLNNLVCKYNNSIISLKHFDDNFGTNHCENIHDILLSYKVPLEKIGLSIQKNYQLSIDESILQIALTDNSNAIKFLFKTKDGFIRKIYNTFKKIKIPTYKDTYNGSSTPTPSIINEKH